MSLQLHDDLSYCSVDGHLIFLDIGKDRYFRLSETMELRFKSHQRGEGTDHDIKALADAGLIVNIQVPTLSPLRPALPHPERSAMELPSTEGSASIADFIDTLWAVGGTQAQLKTRRLASILSGLDTYRRRWTHQGGAHRDKTPAAPLVEAVTAFLQARPYVPIETRCLIDSISLIRFLARRGHAAHLVFGVTAVPFTAHCWAQAGTLVLNDTVGNVDAHTPIRVV